MNNKKILILSELDEFSTMLTEFAVDLAEQINISEIVLLNLILPTHPPTFSTSGAVLAAESNLSKDFNMVLMEKHQKHFEEQAKKFTSDKVKIRPIVRFSNSKTNLNKYMEEYQAALIVCGNRNEHSFLHRLFESDTEKRVRKLDYPLLILQDETDAAKINNILVAIDINEEDDYNNLSEIATFSDSVNAKMQLLHVLTEDSQSSSQTIKELQEIAIANKLSNYDINVVNNNNLEDGIRSFVRKYNPDMIAVLSQGKGKIHKLIFGSSTEDIIKEVDKPVFVSKIR